MGSLSKYLRVRVFYPAEGAAPDGQSQAAPPQPPHAPYMPYGRDTTDGMAGLVKFPGFLLAHLAAADSGCEANAKVAAPAGSGWPVLVYSHGQGGNADMGCYALRSMAAAGCVVLAIEHADGSATHATTEPAEPRQGQGTLRFDGGSAGTGQRVLEVATVAQAVEEQLRTVRNPQGRQDGDYGTDPRHPLPPALARTLNPVGLCGGGHSYGCPTAVLACQVYPQLFKVPCPPYPFVSPQRPHPTTTSHPGPVRRVQTPSVSHPGTHLLTHTMPYPFSLAQAAVLHDPAIAPNTRAASKGCPTPALYVLGDGYSNSRYIRKGVDQVFPLPSALRSAPPTEHPSVCPIRSTRPQ